MTTSLKTPQPNAFPSPVDENFLRTMTDEIEPTSPKGRLFLSYANEAAFNKLKAEKGYSIENGAHPTYEEFKIFVDNPTVFDKFFKDVSNRNSKPDGYRNILQRGEDKEQVRKAFNASAEHAIFIEDSCHSLFSTFNARALNDPDNRHKAFNNYRNVDDMRRPNETEVKLAAFEAMRKAEDDRKNTMSDAAGRIRESAPSSALGSVSLESSKPIAYSEPLANAVIGGLHAPDADAREFLKFSTEIAFNELKENMGLVPTTGYYKGRVSESPPTYGDFTTYATDQTYFERFVSKVAELNNTPNGFSDLMPGYSDNYARKAYNQAALEAVEIDNRCRKIHAALNDHAIGNPKLDGKLFNDARRAQPHVAPPAPEAVAAVKTTILDSNPAGAVIRQLQSGRTLSGGEGKFASYLNAVANGVSNAAEVGAKAVLNRLAYTAQLPQKALAASLAIPAMAGKAVDAKLHQAAESYSARISSYRDVSNPSVQMAMFLSGRRDVQDYLRDPSSHPVPMPNRTVIQHVRDMGGAAASIAASGVDAAKGGFSLLRKGASALRVGLNPFANLRALKNGIVNGALSMGSALKRAYAKAYCATVAVAHSDTLAKARSGLARGALGLSVIGGTIGLLHGIHLGPAAAHAATLGYTGHHGPINIDHTTVGGAVDTTHLQQTTAAIAEQHLHAAGSVQDIQATLAQRGVHLNTDQITQAMQGKDAHLSVAQAGALERSGVHLEAGHDGGHMLSAVSLDQAVEHARQHAHMSLTGQANDIGLPLSDDEKLTLMHGGKLSVYQGQATMFRNLGISTDGHVGMSDIALANERIDALHDGLKAQLGGVDIPKASLVNMVQGGHTSLSWENQQALHALGVGDSKPDMTLADLQKASADHVKNVMEANAKLPEANRIAVHDAFTDMLKRAPGDASSNTASLGAYPTGRIDAMQDAHAADTKALAAEHAPAAPVASTPATSTSTPATQMLTADQMKALREQALVNMQHINEHAKSLTTAAMHTPDGHSVAGNMVAAHLDGEHAVHLLKPAPVHLATPAPETPVHLLKPAPVHLATPAPETPVHLASATHGVEVAHPAAHPADQLHTPSYLSAHPAAHASVHPDTHAQAHHAQEHEVDVVAHGHRHHETASNRLNDLESRSQEQAYALGKPFSALKDHAENASAYDAAAHPGDRGGQVLMAENGHLPNAPELHTASATHPVHTSPEHADAHDPAHADRHATAVPTYDGDKPHYTEIEGHKVDLNKYCVHVNGTTGNTEVLETASLHQHPVQPGSILIRNVNFFAPGPEGHLAQHSVFHDLAQHASHHQTLPEYDGKAMETMQVIAKHQGKAILTDVNGVAMTVNPGTGMPDQDSMVFTVTDKGVQVTPIDHFTKAVESGASPAPAVTEPAHQAVHHMAASGVHGTIKTVEPDGQQAVTHITPDGHATTAKVADAGKEEPGFFHKLKDAAYDATIKPTVDMGKGVVETGRVVGASLGM